MHISRQAVIADERKQKKEDKKWWCGSFWNMRKTDRGRYFINGAIRSSTTTKSFTLDSGLYES